MVGGKAEERSGWGVWEESAWSSLGCKDWRAEMVDSVAAASSAASDRERARENSPAQMSSRTSWARRWVERWVVSGWEPAGMSRRSAQPPVRKAWQRARKVASRVAWDGREEGP